MAFVLSPPSTPHLDFPFGNPICSCSGSSTSDVGTVRRLVVRNASPASFASHTSPSLGALSSKKENSPIAGSNSSLINFRLCDGLPVPNSPRRSWSWAVPIDHSGVRSSPVPFRSFEHLDVANRTFLDAKTPSPSVADLTDDSIYMSPRTGNTDIFSTPPESRSIDTSSVIHHDLGAFDGIGRYDFQPEPTLPPVVDEVAAEDGRTSPLKRWLRTLKRRHVAPLDTLHPPSERWVMDDFDPAPLVTPCRPPRPELRHRKTLSSVSSAAVLSAVKTASVTLASLSLYPRSRRSARNSLNRDDASQPSFSHGRNSFDSMATSNPMMDDGTWFRSMQRNRIVEEIISSEESYIRDLKTLINVYLTVLPRNNHDRKTIQRSVTQVLQLHEDLIAQLLAVRPHQTPSIVVKNERPRRVFSKHIRWHSLDNATPQKPLFHNRRERWARHSIDTSRPSLIQPKAFMADTKLVMDVAKIFDKFMLRFLEYEAYAAYTDLIGESASSLKAFGWDETEKGIEVLSVLTLPSDTRAADHKKGLTFADLIIKPIQRICKYPLFFHDLCKHTPACDDPVTHVELAKVLSRLQSVAEEINYAMSNPDVRKRIEASWLLQHRLEFNNKDVDKFALIHRLGHLLLCGVLHVTYSSVEGIKGQYMICALYRPYLILAIQGKTVHDYQVFAVIPLVNASIDTSDNGRGLQCHTAQFTWKLIFDIDRRHQEIILSACSEMEELTWKNYIRARIIAETHDQAEGKEGASAFHLIDPLVKSMGPSFGPFTNFSRRLSIQRAATLGPKSNLQQVIIKNTEAPRYIDNSATSFSVVRSQSHMSASHIPTLAPRRQDRIKLELAIVDVWTRSALPYPGMNTKRMENPIRASANHVMRKLSIASMTSMTSIASTFSKRSISHSGASISRTNTPAPISAAPIPHAPPPSFDEGYTSSSGQSVRTLRPKGQRKTVVVDFHNTPKAFLPEDFELDIKPRRARKLSARLSMMLETEGSESSGGSRPTSAAKSEGDDTLRQNPLPDASGDITIANVFSFPAPSGLDGTDESDEKKDSSSRPVTATTNALSYRSKRRDSRAGDGPLPQRRLARTRKALKRLFKHERAMDATESRKVS